MRKYVLYTSSPAAVDSAFALINGSDHYDAPSFMSHWVVAENNGHRVAVFSAFDECFAQFCNQLNDIEFLGAIDGSSCDSASPESNFTAAEWAKVDLANARGLFDA